MEQLEIPSNDYINPGHLGCPGCGASIAMKLALKALGEKTIVVIPASCWGVLAAPYPQSSLDVRQHALELRGVRATHPLVSDHLPRDDLNASGAHALKGDVVVEA